MMRGNKDKRDHTLKQRQRYINQLYRAVAPSMVAASRFGLDCLPDLLQKINIQKPTYCPDGLMIKLGSAHSVEVSQETGGI